MDAGFESDYCFGKFGSSLKSEKDQMWVFFSFTVIVV